MKTSRRKDPRLALLLASLAACQSAPAGPAVLPGPVPLPQSALAALVRALEAIDAQRSPATSVQVRAVECDARVDHSRPAEYVRVLLHVTVFAPDVSGARAGFEELRAMLETEARAPARLESVASERVQRVFADMGWRALELTASATPVSYSDAIRLEVRPGQAGPGGPLGPAQASLAPSKPALRYVEDIAQASGIALAPVATRPNWGLPGTRELRCTLRPAGFDAHYTRAQIGAFLRELEARSPAARLTHILIERNTQLSDVTREDGWTFEVELTLRVPA